MLKQLLPYLLALSVAVNIPFIAMWAKQANSSTTGKSVAESPTRDRHSGERHRHAPPSPKDFMMQIGVTEEQWRNMEPRQTKFHAELKSLAERSRSLNAELTDLIFAKEFNPQAVASKQSEIADCDRARQQLIIDNVKADRTDLTPEQFAKLHEILLRKHSERNKNNHRNRSPENKSAPSPTAFFHHHCPLTDDATRS